MTNQIVPRRRLKPFKQFLPGCFRGRRQWEAFGKRLTEETLDSAITGAAAIVIDSTSTDEERAKAISDFAEEISNMNGQRIVAIAIVTN